MEEENKTTNSITEQADGKKKSDRRNCCRRVPSDEEDNYETCESDSEMPPTSTSQSETAEKPNDLSQTKSTEKGTHNLAIIVSTKPSFHFKY